MPVNVGRGAEYLVKLGVDVDQNGVSQIQRVFDLMNNKSVQLSVALGAVGTALYGFVKNATAYEFQLVQMAKEQHKTTQEVRASDNALKAMGKSMEEIKKDKYLETIYKDIVKVNKGLSLPNLTRSLNLVNELRGAFYGLRSSVQYVVQWINAHILANLERPIKRVTEALRGIRQWINENMNVISEKVASFLTAFAKSLFAILDVGMKIAKWFTQLPQIIRTIGGSIVMLFAMIKAGPLGWLLGLVNVIGAAIDDYDNFVENKTERGRFMSGEYDSFDSALSGMNQQQREAYYGEITAAFDAYEANGKNVGALTERQQTLYNKYKGSNLYASTTLDRLWDPISDESLDFSEKATAVATALQEMLSTAFASVSTWIATEGWPFLFGDGTAENTGLVGAIGSFFSGFGTMLINAYNDHKAEIDIAWDKIWNGALVAEPGSSSSGQVVTKRQGGLKSFFEGLWKGFLGMFQDGGILKEGMDAISTFFTTIWEGAEVTPGGPRQGGLKKLIFGEDGGGGIWDSVKSGFMDLITFIGEQADNIYQKLKPVIDKIGDALYEVIFNTLGSDVASKLGLVDPSKKRETTSWNNDEFVIDDRTGQLTTAGLAGEHGRAPQNDNETQWINNANAWRDAGNSVEVVDGRMQYKTGGVNALGQAEYADFSPAFMFQRLFTQFGWNETYTGSGRNKQALRLGGQDYGTYSKREGYGTTSNASGTVTQASVSDDGQVHAISGSFQAEGGVLTGDFEAVGMTAGGNVEFRSVKGEGSVFLSPSAVKAIAAAAGAKQNAWGGKISSFTYTSVGEEGPEYIIPMTKPARAKSLIKQMLGEMGGSAVSEIVGELGMDGGSSTIGGNLLAGGSLGTAAGVTNTYNINAPVTINVSASGADAERVGVAAYNAAERYLIKNLQGAFA